MRGQLSSPSLEEGEEGGGFGSRGSGVSRWAEGGGDGDGDGDDELEYVGQGLFPEVSLGCVSRVYVSVIGVFLCVRDCVYVCVSLLVSMIVMPVWL